ncbi:MFS transporter [Micromonospora sp. NPDC048999]|uniref:MFS transporter n=1 Tax=Micromonospora sp. NPDC048999 TaxID=3155391 RepID=UPI003408C2DC
MDLRSSTAESASGRAPTRAGALLALLCAANLLAIFDSQIAGVALPSIQRDLVLSTTEAQWIISANLLTWGSLLLLGGRAADYFGRRRIFLAGLSLYLLTSLTAGLASNGGTLVASRAAHGVSAAMMYPTALSILTNTFPQGGPRNRALALWAGMGGVGSTLGLLVGGGVVNAWGWRWGFYLHVPITAAMIVIALRLLPRDHVVSRPRSLDLTGALTITAALGLLVYGIAQAPADGWTSPKILGIGALAIVGVALFVLVERRSAAPLMPLGILRSRLRAGGNLVIFFTTMIAFALSFLYSLYAQEVAGYSPMKYALAAAVASVMVIIAAYVGQAALNRFGFRPVAVTGMVLFGAGALLFARMPVHGSYLADSLLPLVLEGAGLGAATLAASAAALTDVAGHEAGLASGVNTATTMIAGGLGVAVVATVAASRTGVATGPAALNSGFQAGFASGAVMALVGLVLAIALLGLGRRARAAQVAEAAPVQEVS